MRNHLLIRSASLLCTEHHVPPRPALSNALGDSPLSHRCQDKAGPLFERKR